MPTSTSLNLRALLKAAANRTGMGAAGGGVSGLSAAAKALYVAAARAANPAALVVVVVPGDADVEQTTCDLRFFLSALEGISDTAAERDVLPFPSHQVDPYRGMAPHLRVASARARALHALAAQTARVVVASAAALLPRVADPERLLRASCEIRPGTEIDPVALTELLADAGFTREDPVDEHGEFCVRGGIVDIFPAGDERPVRLEFVGDVVESVRRFDPATQRSVGTLDHLIVPPLRETFDNEPASVSFFDYLHAGARPMLFVSEESEVRAQVEKTRTSIEQSYADSIVRETVAPPPHDIVLDVEAIEAQFEHATVLDELGLGAEGEADIAAAARENAGQAAAIGAYGRHIACQPAIEFNGRIADWAADVRRARERGDTVLFVAATPGRAERVVELLAEHELLAMPMDRAEDAHAASVLVAVGALSRGFRLPAAELQIVAETDVFEEERRVQERRRLLARTFLSDLRDLKTGDLVVHIDHGIGSFVGLKQIGIGGGALQEFMELRYAGDDKLFVPVERLDLVQKYTGAPHPALDRLGGTSWERAKTRVRKAMRDMAEELLKLYASRKAMPGHAFSPDSHWQQEFEDAFEYDLTPDQRTAIADIKRDMEVPAPMDRLLCGDVGYGKTEVAMRAAFKAVMDGKQVAMLAPTTVLAFQHLKTLRERFAAFPVRIDMVSRFRSKVEQKQVITDLAAGKVEIIVGTHRLLSKDVAFRDLGLLIVDEEQRFGVAHKEKIKQLRRRIDVLTMSATPIPRTLNMSLVGIRDMSIIETPPKDRLSIQTNVVRFDQHLISRSVRNELARGGQVYFVHNRIESIFSIAQLMTRLVPEARVTVAHGQMDEEALERAMLDFIDRRSDVLLATTIIENGLDIPNVNTIIINRADRYGLSQLYQLRGRVGRSDRPAYAYLLIPPQDSLSAVARKRLAAIKEFSDLGSGFRVAALDLEIRGAGNLLGGEQSGHIEAVGFEMYMKLLEQTVRELKGEEIEEETRAVVNLQIDLRIDELYIPDMNQRLMVYRRIAAARSNDELGTILEELKDRYGALPASLLNLVAYGRIRVLADRLGIEALEREGQLVVVRFKPQARIDPARLVRLVRERVDVSLAPPATLRMDLRIKPGERPVSRTPPVRHAGRQEGRGPSWWTARATAGEVKPGFSKGEILRLPPEDPRAEGGVIARIEGLLSELDDLR